MSLSHDNTIYVISGTCGVGKSTTAYKLAEQYALSAHINADNIYNMTVGGYLFPRDDLKMESMYLQLLWANIGSLVGNYIERQITSVIDYVVFSEDVHFIEDIKQKYQLQAKYIVLTADEETLLNRDNSRLTDRMGARVIELLHEFKAKNISEQFIIDTTLKNSEEIVAEIITNDRFFV